MNKRNYGWKKDKIDHRDKKFKLLLEHSVTYPNECNLISNMPPVYDQSTLGSCSANAIGAAIKYNLNKQEKDYEFNPSRLFIYYNERKLENSIPYDSGAMLRDGIKTVNENGVCDEKLWPYDIEKFTQQPIEQCYTEAQLHQALSYESLNNSNINELFHHLSDGNPIIFGFQVFESFEGPEVAKTGILEMPKTTEQCLGGHAVLCLSEDTIIPLLDGRKKSLKDLHAEYGEKSFWVYSCDENKKIVAGKAHSLKKTGINRKLLAITLDNTEILKCTPDHKIMMRDGTYKEAQYLQSGDSLMPFYSKLSNTEEMKNYEMIMQPNTNVWQYTHRAIASSDGKYDGIVHHKDFNKYNNTPENLQIMTWDEHTKLHHEQVILLEEYSKSPRGREKSRELMKKLWNDPIWRENRLKQNALNGKKVSEKLKKEGRCGFQDLKGDDLEQFKFDTSQRSKMNGCKQLHTKEAIEKNKRNRKLKYENDLEFREKIKQTAIKNLNKYNDHVKDGVINLTDTQITARKNNAIKMCWNKYYKSVYPNFEDYIAAKENNTLNRNNHKVIKVEDCGYGDVYDLTVDTHHNFATCSGIFVHNCSGYDQTKKAFLVRNSWSANWGINGYFWMPFDYMTNTSLASDFWVIKTMETI